MSAAVEAKTGPLIGLRAVAAQIIILVGAALGLMALTGRRPLIATLLIGHAWWSQLAVGVTVGLSVAVPLITLIMKVEWFLPFRRQCMDFISRADLGGLNPLWFSLCAGVGEEMLFRGALQPPVGIWLTSLVFTLAHYGTGGFRTMNRMKAVYAVMLFLASMLLGALFADYGLISAMTAHTAMDLVALSALRSAPAAGRSNAR